MPRTTTVLFGASFAVISLLIVDPVLIPVMAFTFVYCLYRALVNLDRYLYGNSSPGC